MFSALIKSFRQWVPYDLRRLLLRVFGGGTEGARQLSIDRFNPDNSLSWVNTDATDLDRYKYLSSDQQPQEKVSIIIPTINNLEYLRLCLNSIWRYTNHGNYSVILVDNGSQGEVIEHLLMLEQQEPRLKVIINNRNLGFAKACNIGIKYANDSHYYVLLNNDTIVTPMWMSKLLAHMEDSSIHLVGPVTNSTGNEAQIVTQYDDINSLEKFSEAYCSAHARQTFEIHMLAMFCIMFRKSLIEGIGFLDERFELGLFEDDDYSMRVRVAGGGIVCAEDVFIHHWGSATMNQLSDKHYDALFRKNRQLFEKKWGIKWIPPQHQRS
jgi:O-antigen biosynthesis protein